MPVRPKTDQEKNPENYFINPRGHIRDRVIIHESADIPKEGLFVSLNGFAFLIKPNEEIDLPRPVLKMLDTKIRTDTFYDEDGKEYKKNIPRVTYHVIQRDVHSAQPPTDNITEVQEDSIQ